MATFGFGSSSSGGGFGASTGGGFGGFGAAPASTAAAPAFGAPAAAPAFGASAAASSSAPAFGAASAPAFGAPTAAPAATGGFGGFGAGTAGAAKPAAVGFGAASTGGGFGVAASTGGGFGAASTGGGFGAAASTGGGFGQPGVAAAGGFGATAAQPSQATAAQSAPSAADRIANVVCPIEGVQRLLMEMDDKGQPVLSKEAGEVLDAFNQQIAAWSPWHPSLLAHYGRLAQSGTFKAVEEKARQMQSLDPVSRDKQLRELTPQVQQLVEAARMPRFDAMTLQGPMGNNRTPPDVVENQFGTSDWKPLLDNPHSRFRHYVLQPLTQAQMKLPAEQRHGLHQTAASSPNDPLFQAKLQENPNPYKYCVLPVVGFHQLLRRVEMQDEKLAEQHSVLQRLEGEVNRMREFQTVQLPKMLAQRRATQVELGRRALEVMRRLEMQKQPSAQGSRDMQVLGERLDQVSQMSTTLQRRMERLEELMGELRMQDRKRLKQRPVAAATCDQEALMRLDAFLEHRKTGVAHLRDIVSKDLEDTQMAASRLTAS